MGFSLMGMNFDPLKYMKIGAVRIIQLDVY